MVTELEQVEIRPAGMEDIGFLWTALFYASHSDHEGRTVDDIKSEPTLLRYLNEWGRDGDMGVVAAHHSVDVGAAWLRLIDAGHASDPAYVDQATPELAIAVLPSHQGLGVGTAMLSHLIENARGVYPAIVLSVRAGNPAIRLYERLGFLPAGTITNRVGTESLKMILSLR